jgi:hypothetical protein
VQVNNITLNFLDTYTPISTGYEELLDLYSSPNIVRVIKSRIMRWAGNVARVGRREAFIGFWWGNLRK